MLKLNECCYASKPVVCLTKTKFVNDNKTDSSNKEDFTNPLKTLKAQKFAGLPM